MLSPPSSNAFVHGFYCKLICITFSFMYLKSLNTIINITHSFRFKNTHKNITVRCHAQAVSKHFPFTFFAAQQSSSPLNTVGKITSALRNQDQIFILCPARFALEMPVCYCGCGSLTWVCGSKCVFLALPTSSVFWVQLAQHWNASVISISSHHASAQSCGLFVPPSPLWPSHSTVCLLLFGDLILHET